MIRYCETKNFQKNRDIPLLGIKIFDTWNFLKHRRILNEMIRYWDKTISTQNRETHLLSYP